MRTFPHSEFYGFYGTIYTLSTKDGNVFYVGCTIRSIEERFADHIIEAKENCRGNVRKNTVIRDANFDIVITPTETKWATGIYSGIGMSELRKIERKWLYHFEDSGHKLCNREIDMLHKRLLKKIA